MNERKDGLLSIEGPGRAGGRAGKLDQTAENPIFQFPSEYVQMKTLKDDGSSSSSKRREKRWTLRTERRA